MHTRARKIADHTLIEIKQNFNIDEHETSFLPFCFIFTAFFSAELSPPAPLITL